MKIKYFDGDVFTSDARLILHAVNCQGVMGSGVAKTVKERYPNVFFEYKNMCNTAHTTSSLLGEVQKVDISEKQSIVNCFTQDNYGAFAKGVPTSYDAVNKCFKFVALMAMTIAASEHPDGPLKIALPYGMCSVRGGACWNVILEMLKDAFKTLDVVIEIWKYTLEF